MVLAYWLQGVSVDVVFAAEVCEVGSVRGAAFCGFVGAEVSGGDVFVGFGGVEEVWFGVEEAGAGALEDGGAGCVGTGVVLGS